MVFSSKLFLIQCQIEDAVALVVKAVASGVFNDLGSGSNIDVTIITKDAAEVRRNYITPNERKHPPAVYYYPPGTTGKTKKDFLC